jgi:hypothetical protein
VNSIAQYMKIYSDVVCNLLRLLVAYSWRLYETLHYPIHLAKEVEGIVKYKIQLQLWFRGYIEVHLWPDVNGCSQYVTKLPY